jgi:hypothetical protein
MIFGKYTMFVSMRSLKRGAGYFLPGIWGCPPASKLPQDWGIKGLI